MIEFGFCLKKIIGGSIHLNQVHKEDLQFGDMVFITTRNSVYSVYVLDNDFYLIYGGWFDRKGLSPIKTTITGCIWGGSIIKEDTVATCGLRLEFGNRIVTTPIQKICVLRCSGKN